MEGGQSRWVMLGDNEGGGGVLVRCQGREGWGVEVNQSDIISGHGNIGYSQYVMQHPGTSRCHGHLPTPAYEVLGPVRA